MVEDPVGAIIDKAGYPIEHEFVQLDLYRLLSCFGGSRLIAESMAVQNLWIQQCFSDLRSYIERSEISRLLISIAAASRNCLDRPGPKANDLDGLPPMEVGTFYPSRATQKEAKPLIFREACNKIIHASSIAFEVEQRDGDRDEYLLPIVHLYGDRDEVPWKATLNVSSFVFWANRSM